VKKKTVGGETTRRGGKKAGRHEGKNKKTQQQGYSGYFRSNRNLTSGTRHRWKKKKGKKERVRKRGEGETLL